MGSIMDSADEELPLPAGFSSIEQIKNFPSNLVQAGQMVQVIGFVKDFRSPMKTNGPDFKCTIEIIDYSTRYESYGFQINIFRSSKEKMPQVCGVADVVLIRNIKVQMRNGAISLLAHKSSEFYILSAAKVPKSPSGASNLPWQPYPPGRRRYPNAAETSYVIWASSRTKDMELPSDHEFQERKAQSTNIKDKFTLLKDAKPDKFYNIIGEVRKVYDSSGPLTMYLSDYTPNSLFYNHAWGGHVNEEGREGDEYGYIKPSKKATEDWSGPYGKLSLQLTLYDEHAEYVREYVKVEDWVLLKNVQIKYGKSGGYLEGFLRRDGGKIGVEIMKQARDPEENNVKWVEALKRKLQWKNKFEQQRDDIQHEPTGLGDKRKHDGEQPSKNNSKKRRQEKRAAAEKKVADAKAKAREQLDLNEYIRCAFPDQPILTLAEILKHQTIIRCDDGQSMPSPFTLSKYRSIVRVVDYFPHKIEDFAVGRRASEFDMLSDYSGGEDTDPGEDMRIFKSGKGFAKHVWEWRFALQVEDASSKDSKERLWLVVDNHAAQALLGLEGDATNLRVDQKLLNQVKEQLFKLWGDLEEQKSETLQQHSKDKTDLPPSSIESEFPDSEPTRKAGEMPNADSDCENEQLYSNPSKKKSNSSILAERDSNISTSGVGLASTLDTSDAKLAPKNKAFTCCIKQYGVKVHEDNPAKANAGEEQRWQRIFGLCNTQIM